jgi:hypothetical protein
VKIITREQWGAVHEDGYGTSTLPAEEVWLHHSVTIAPDLVPPFDDEAAAVRALERIGEAKFGRGISYTFAVVPTGHVFEGHSVEREGAHTAGRNDAARAIVLVGNYDVDRPTPAMQHAVAELLVEGVRRGWWRRARLNGGHQQAPGARTACPGRYGLEAVPRINDLAARLSAGPDPLEDDDMALTDEDVERIAQRTRQVVADGNRRYGLDALRGHLVAIRQQLATGVNVDVDEAQLAKELAPLLIGTLPTMPPAVLHELAAAVITESGHRLAQLPDPARLLAAVPEVQEIPVEDYPAEPSPADALAALETGTGAEPARAYGF